MRSVHPAAPRPHTRPVVMRQHQKQGKRACAHLPRLLNDPGDEPSMPLPSGGVAPISQPTSREGGDSPRWCLRRVHVGSGQWARVVPLARACGFACACARLQHAHAGSMVCECMCAHAAHQARVKSGRAPGHNQQALRPARNASAAGRHRAGIAEGCRARDAGHSKRRGTQAPLAPGSHLILACARGTPPPSLPLPQGKFTMQDKARPEKPPHDPSACKLPACRPCYANQDNPPAPELHQQLHMSCLTPRVAESRTGLRCTRQLVSQQTKTSLNWNTVSSDPWQHDTTPMVRRALRT